MAQLPPSPDLIASQAGAGDGGAIDLPGGTPGGPNAQPTDDLARRARAWYLEARTSRLWDTYVKESSEDQEFYIGGEGQWLKENSRDDLNRLKALGRAVISINHCKPIVDVLVGFERQNRFDIKATPQGDEDDEDARILSWILKFVQDQAEIPEYISEAFKLGLIRGMSCLAVEVDWTTDPVNGEIVCDVLTPGRDVIWDPHWKKYDLSDAAYVLRFKWVLVDDLIAQYPEHRDKILAAVTAIHASMTPFEQESTSGPRSDSYGSTTSHPIEPEPVMSPEREFYDPKLRRIMVLEPWWMAYEPQHIVTDKIAGKVETFTTSDAARTFAASDPKHLTYIRKFGRQVMTGVVIPATGQTLEEGPTPYDNDAENYPFVPYVADKIDDVVMGILRNIKDPQRVENKRISQAMDIVARYCNMRPIAEETSLVNPDALKNSYDTSPIWVKAGRKYPGFLVPEGLGQVVNVLVELAQLMKTAPRESSGINTDLLGIKGDTSSGIAIARRQAQGQVIATPFFDGLRRTRKIVGQRLARRIQQRFTTEQVLRLIDDAGNPVSVRVNAIEFGKDRVPNVSDYRRQRQAEVDAGRPHVLRDLSALKWDVVITESPATPTARQAALLTLLDVVEKMPALMPAVIDVILELADVPQRQRILQRVEQIVGQQFGGTAGGGSQPPMTAAHARPPQPVAAAGPPPSSVAPQPPGPPVPSMPSPTMVA